MTLLEFGHEVRQTRKLNKGWREGQTYVNVLAQVRPDLSAKVLDLQIDPFYQDEHIPAFLQYVHDNW